MSDSFNNKLAEKLHEWCTELGFEGYGITDASLNLDEKKFERWLDRGFHGTMDWLKDHREKRFYPAKLVPGTVSIISVRMNYFPENSKPIQTLKSPHKAYIARYALGRDYHKVMRKRLALLAKKIDAYAKQHQLDTHFASRAFVDSAPVFERAIAEKANLGWTGKHTLVIDKHAGSWFFLGELFTNIKLPSGNETQEDLCGTCEACLKICPTDAFNRAYELNASRCISYLTIEHKGSIPEEFREPMGNRIFGCDDCQLICPWNKEAQISKETDFSPRHQLDSQDLISLFNWDEDTFLQNTEGSPIRRTGYQSWLRNIAIALGNAPSDIRIMEALEEKKAISSDPVVIEHVNWALTRHRMGHTRRRKIKNRNKID